MISTIFPGLNEDVDRYILLFSDPCSLAALSRVNKTAYSVLSNDFFCALFQKNHALIQGDIYKNSLDILRTCHPNNCWKVASCVFATAIFNPSYAFLREEPFPFFQSMIQPRKEQVEREFKEMSGAYFADPNALVSQAWEAYKKSEEVLGTSQKALKLLGRCKGFESGDSEVNKSYEKIKIFCSEKDAFLIKSLIFCFSVKTYEDRIRKCRLSSIEELKVNVSSFEELQLIVCSFFSDNAIFLKIDNDKFEVDVNCALLLFDESLFYEYIVLFDFFYNAHLTVWVKSLESREFCRKYYQSERKRKKCSEILYRIKRCSNIFSKSSIFTERYRDCFADMYKIYLKKELFDLIEVEKCQLTKNTLGQFLPLLRQVDKNPILINSIRCLINSCPDYVKINITKALYKHCINGVIEECWSENHYREFLPVLRRVIDVSYGKASRDCARLRSAIGKRGPYKFEELINKFIKYS